MTRKYHRLVKKQFVFSFSGRPARPGEGPRHDPPSGPARPSGATFSSPAPPSPARPPSGLVQPPPGPRWHVVFLSTASPVTSLL
jgi:hypothetical protein